MNHLTEWSRRLLSLGFLLTGIWFAIMPGPEMLVIEHQNFEESLNNRFYYRPKDLTLEQFKRDQLESRTVEVNSTHWKELLDTVASGRKGSANQIIPGGHLYWLTDVPAYDSTWPDFVFVHMEGTDDYFSVTRAFPLAIYGIDRSRVYPQRGIGLTLIAVCFLIYFILPSVKRLPERIYYSKAASILLPDLMGLFGTAFFFALPTLIIAENNPGSLPWTLDGGWWILTASLWIIGAVFMSMIFIANHYATLWYEITPSGLAINRGSKTTLYPWTNMKSCKPYVGTMGRKLGRL